MSAIAGATAIVPERESAGDFPSSLLVFLFRCAKLRIAISPPSRFYQFTWFFPVSKFSSIIKDLTTITLNTSKKSILIVNKGPQKKRRKMVFRFRTDFSKIFAVFSFPCGATRNDWFFFTHVVFYPRDYSCFDP